MTLSKVIFISCLMYLGIFGLLCAFLVIMPPLAPSARAMTHDEVVQVALTYVIAGAGSGLFVALSVAFGPWINGIKSFKACLKLT